MCISLLKCRSFLWNITYSCLCAASLYTLGTFTGGRQSGAVLYNTFGVMGKSRDTERGGLLASNNSSDSPTGSGYNTDVSEDNLPCDRISPSSDINGNSVSDEQVCSYWVEMIAHSYCLLRHYTSSFLQDPLGGLVKKKCYEHGMVC